ncbi:hypothetical protein KSS87_017129 [Heliosperma pusillum]|nr:hypothetical protein KSS87_017129 [Heliosperma pusillum]
MKHFVSYNNVFLTMMFFSLFLQQSANADPGSTRSALLALRQAVGGRTLLWKTESNPCSWYGVQCRNDVVVGLQLPGFSLSGEIPLGIFKNLTSLKLLSLRFNALSGNLPSDLGSCDQLRSLYLQDNALSGVIPGFISSLKNLVRLNLGNNNFTGEVSGSFRNLSRLKTLYLENNRLTGVLPEWKLELDQFNVSNNLLNGTIPVSLAAMPVSAFQGTKLCGKPLQICPGLAAGTGVLTGEHKKKKGGLSGGAIAGIVVGSVVAFAVILMILVLIFGKKRKSQTNAVAFSSIHKQIGVEKTVAEEEEEENNMGYRNGGYSVAATEVAAVPVARIDEPNGGIGKKLVFYGNGVSGKKFDLEELLRASAEVLGKGTFGTAYKAVMEIGTVVAVKRLKDVVISEGEFKEKIHVVGSMEHENLVPLRAYYYSQDEKLLVYDYMPMGSLSAFLHGNKGGGRTPLNWEMRSSIALAVARGITHLHSQGSKISHGNIKSSNVLLTKSYEAKVSDFGLAQLVGPSTTPNRVNGYRAPEVTDLRKVSQQADVYSYGVLLLELLTGKAPTHALLNEEGVDLPRWVQSVVKDDWASEVFDMELLRYQHAEEEMVQLLQLAIDCTAQYPDSRPSMSEVTKRVDELCSPSAKEGDDLNPAPSTDMDGQLPRPPAHGRYDLGNNEARRRKANMMKFGCVGVLAAIIIGLAIYGIILLFSFKNAQVPHFQVKAVEVSKFNVADVVMAKQKVLSTDLAFNLESDNKNPMVGVKLENMVMETNWNDVEAHLGEAHIENVALNSKGVSTLKVTTRGEVEISKKLVNKEDMKLDLVLSGDLKFVHGPFKTKTYPFMVSCNEIKGVSINAACDSKLFSNGETPPPSTRKVKAPAPAPQAAVDKPTAELPAEKQPPSSSGSKESVPQPSLESSRGKQAVEPPAVSPTVAPQMPGVKTGAAENAPVASLPKESLPPTPHDKAKPGATENMVPASLPKESLPPTPLDKALPEPQQAPSLPKESSLPPSPQDKALPEPQAVRSLPKESLPPVPQEPRPKPVIEEPKLPPSPPKESFPPVKLEIQDKFVILSNGLLAATIANPDGFITGINYNGIDNILDTVNPEDDRGYWDVVWAPPGTKGTKGTFQRPDQIELSFKLPYNPSTDAKKAAPMEIDQRYVMLQGVSGIYAYGIFERAGWDQFGMPNARLAFKLQRQMFKYMVVADNRQREMPVPEDRMKPRGQELEYPEAVMLLDPIDPKLKGEVDDKYQYSKESQDIRVHGWICKDPPSGFWQITPSFEFRSGGPNKQFLTSHVGPSTLAMLAEVQKWPYSFPASEDFPKANERVNVTGRFFVHDKFVTNEKVPAKNAFIGLGPPGEAGSWQRDCKVRFNQPKPSPAIFTSGRIGNDNSIARHGIHGLYWLFNIDVKGSTLLKGSNTMFLTQTKGVSPFQGLMYDYIRLEGPSRSPK